MDNPIKQFQTATKSLCDCVSSARFSLIFSRISNDRTISVEEIDNHIKLYANIVEYLEHILKITDSGGIFCINLKSATRGTGGEGISSREWKVRSDTVKFLISDGADIDTAFDAVSNYSIDGCIEILVENGIYD